MPTIHVSTHCDAPVEQVFEYAADHTRVPEWFYGLTSWKPLTEQTRGIGARFEGTVHLGATLRSTVEAVDFVENELIAITSVKGFPNASRWQFTPSEGGTRVDCELTYDFPGGLAGKALAKVVEPFVKIAVAHATKEFTERAAAPR
ncbi:SRPBCC family protein [Nocardioides sp. Kera G14]|uniref:SRPBCC family protein n=1 Tax=Nocardioides sp. Kera G14 TaxID=2884264 RepID=UPI001D1226CF|nr:SRPBCC family protein [Nocardioides sp. Kera G14]UDY24417.1 SRPBCC family protein [Nocardioides sp. Kera G14]